MRIGLMDLGSNTTKMTVYSVESSGFSQIYYNADYTYIISHVKNGKLSDEGIEKLGIVVNKFRQVSVELKCAKLECFSTASLRYISNLDEVISKIYAETRVHIIPLSGEQEAHYNFLSMKLVAKENDFLGGDLGGGSLQLFSCVDSKQGAVESFKLGALSMFEQFVHGDFPTVDEANLIKNHVLSVLQTSASFAEFSSENLYMMGGTVRTVCKLLDSVDNSFSLDELHNIMTNFVQHEAEAKEQIEAIVPERLTTIVPGMLVICTICKHMGVKQIHYTQNSVREGYLVEKYLRKNSKNSK